MKTLMRLGKKYGVSLFVVMTVLSLNLSAVMASPTTGDTDLDNLMNSMTGGLDVVKAGGLIIVGGVIAIAIVFLGARWLWNMFRSWLSRAQ